jgi:hypothetical protein
LKPIASVVARLARILENVAIQEEMIQEKMKVWERKLPHLFLLHIRSCKSNPLVLLAFL